MAKIKCPMCGKEHGEHDSPDQRTMYLYCKICKPIVMSVDCSDYALHLNTRSGDSPYVLDHYR